jgi:hypothetical protein
MRGVRWISKGDVLVTGWLPFKASSLLSTMQSGPLRQAGRKQHDTECGQKHHLGIVAADTNMATFNGICGAESGGVPVSASSPGIFVTQIEVQKKAKSQERIPLLPAPFEGGK